MRLSVFQHPAHAIEHRDYVNQVSQLFSARRLRVTAGERQLMVKLRTRTMATWQPRPARADHGVRFT